LLAQGSTDAQIQLWSMSGQSRRMVLACRAVPQRIELSADDRYLAAVSRKLIQLFDLQTGQSTALPMPGNIRWLGFTHAAQRLTVVAGNQVLSLSVARPQAPPRRLMLHAEAASAAMDGEGSRLVVGTTDNALVLCDLKRKRLLGAPIRQTDRAHVLAFSPDGELLASDEGLTRVQLWSLSSRQRYGKPFVFSEPVMRLDFRTDGRQLAIQTETTLCTREISQEPQSLRQLELLTWVSLDARKTARGTETIPPSEWRQMRDRLRNTVR
jgi:WD40 repeat protein